MTDNLAEVMRLLSLAQTGEREQALASADRQLRTAESPGFLYVRAIALHSRGDHEGAAHTAERILALTAGGGEPGWRPIALALRAWQHLLLSETNRQASDLESILHDLAQAEVMLTNGDFDAFFLATAHTCLGNGYLELRLYELGRPNYEAAFAAATATKDEVVIDRALGSQLNLATMHLNWSMELHRIRDSVGAQEKGVIAAGHAAIAQEYVSTDETKAFAVHLDLLVACAESIQGNDGQVMQRIRDALKVLAGRGLRESTSYALPFLARALERAGQHTEALEVAEQAVAALPQDASWTVAATAYHTQATLLAQSGSPSAQAILAYGDQLAETMWRQRLRTLHDVRAMQFVERVTLERDRIQVLANTDALTGVGNRRAFDVRMAELGAADDPADVALIVVDVDRLKAVNDAGGHEAGDRALKAVAGALTSQIRSGDLVARVGGDEFVAVLNGMDRAAAGEVAQGMADAVSAALGSTVTVSVGVATGPAPEAGSSLLRAADRAMYAAKRNRSTVTTGAQPAVEDPSRTG
jgi:diguanylate cyclase (GGDEF)-like protein